MRHAWLVLGALQLCACNAILGIGDFTVRDGPPPPPDGGDLCLGSLVNVCFDLPQPDLNGLGDRIDTDVDCTLVANADAGAICVVLAQTLELFGPTRVIGSRPLMVIAVDSLTLSGATLDASSLAGPVTQTGAGADSILCEALPSASEDKMLGSGGGAGAALGSVGGEGGQGAGPNASGAPGGLPQPIVTLRGGCSGGPGANGLGPAGSGGPGGGAIYLVAGNVLSLDGASNVFASGAGGAGGGANAGGGGGGSGGLVALEAATLVLDGILAANGGGGGGGGSGNGAGKVGGNGTTFEFMLLAPGGGVDGSAGVGGEGGGFSRTAGNPGGNALDGGGGGGGGSAGAVWLKGDVQATALRASPEPLFN